MVLSLGLGAAYDVLGGSTYLPRLMEGNAVNVLAVFAVPYFLLSLSAYHVGIGVGRELETRQNLLSDEDNRRKLTIDPQDSERHA